MNYWAVRAYNYYYGITHALEYVQMSAQTALKDLWPGPIGAAAQGAAYPHP